MKENGLPRLGDYGGPTQRVVYSIFGFLFHRASEDLYIFSSHSREKPFTFGCTRSEQPVSRPAWIMHSVDEFVIIRDWRGISII